MSANNSGHEDAAGKTHAASGVRPITREDEGRVREAIHRAMLSVIEDREPPLLHFAPDGNLKTIESSEGFGLCAAELGALGRAGIVPGPDGWRWAAPAPIAKGDRLCSRTTGRVYTARAFLSDFTRYPGGPLQGPGWKLEDEDEDGMPAWETVSDLNNTEKWERVGPRLAPTVILDAPSQPAGMGEQRAIVATIAGAPSDRPAALRAALLTVLSCGPIEGLARLLPALDAAMGESPGVARATGAEARQAAREVGAEVDGARWSLPAMVTGWGWRLSRVPRCWFLTRLDAEDVEGEAVAVVARNAVVPSFGWRMLPDGEPEWTITVEEAQTAALTAARRAGLFAPRSAPPAVEVTGDGGGAALPAVTAKGGEPVVLDPLAALARHICGVHAYEPGSDGMRAAMANASELAPHLAAWGAELVEQARASVKALPEIKAMRSPRVTIEGPTLRVYAEDGETVVHEERVSGEDAPIPPAQLVAEARELLEKERVLTARAVSKLAAAIAERQSADRSAAEARLEAEAAAAARDTLARDYAAERALSESLRAQLDEAETARDDARAALSDLRAALADLAARWAGGAA